MSLVFGASDVVRHVGDRLRQRRADLRLSRPRLAAQIGTAYQTIEKYETGLSQITATRLYQLAAALNVEVSYFFEGLTEARS